MNIVILTVFFVLPMLAALVLMIWALVDLVKRPPAAWANSGHNQLVWALVVVFVGFIGPVLYLLIARPALDAVSHSTIESPLGA